MTLIADNVERVYDEAFLRDLVHDVVQTIKRNLKVDWTEPHRDQVRAKISRGREARAPQTWGPRG